MGEKGWYPLIISAWFEDFSSFSDTFIALLYYTRFYDRHGDERVSLVLSSQFSPVEICATKTLASVL